jgi:hypothetical protein
MTARFTPTEFAMQLDSAKARAHALRQEAIRAGWDALGHALLRAWHAAGRWMPRHEAATMTAWRHLRSHSSKARSATARSSGAITG